MNKNTILDCILLSLVFTFCISFPINYFVEDPLALTCCEIGLRLISISFTIIFSRKSRNIYLNDNQTNWKNFLILLPTFLICFNNLIYLCFNESTISVNYDNQFIANVALTIVTAISEELIFRKVIMDNIRTRNRLVRVIIAAGVFAFFHIFNFFVTFNPYYLIQVVYTFGLGIVLGFLYEYTHNVYISMSCHFLFNFINTDLYLLISNPNEGKIFYLVSASTAIVVGIYLLLIYLFNLRKQFE